MKKYILSIILLFLISNVFADDLNNKINKFWNFISKNEYKIMSADNPELPIYDEIFNQIQLIDTNVFVMLENKITNGKKNMVITANGNSDYFQLCDKIVSMAPKYKTLNPISLFPKLDAIEPFIYMDITLKAEDVKVHFDNVDTQINLLFLLPEEHLSRIRADQTYYLYNIYLQMLFMMTQQVLGERTTGNKIESGEISLVNILVPAAPILNLPNYIK